MELGGDLANIAFMVMVAVAVGGLALAILAPFMTGSKINERVDQISDGQKESRLNAFKTRFSDDQKDVRRRQIQESLKQIGEEERNRKKKVTLRVMIAQAGLSMSVKMFWLISAMSGTAFFVVPFFFGTPWFICAATAFVGFLGLPRWFLGMLRKRRQNTFLHDLADAIDVMVRGLKAGLPVSEALKIIASETGPPVGPEFNEVVEGQRVGISIDQGIQRMVDRMPLPEVNFLAIVMTIQAKTGGNLSEALGNLSRVLRDRKRMKQKIRSISQEAKSSAAIIGALPFCIMIALAFLSPDYLTPMYTTDTGTIVSVASGVWMTMGVLVMRKMINFDI
jgi:tight adherence protein B